MNKTLYLLLVATVIVVALWLIIKYWGGSKSKTLEKFDDEGQSKPQVILFHAKWCKYCVEYLSETLPESGKNVFDTVSDTLGDHVTFTKADVDEAQDLAEKYNVSSFPSIIGVSSNGVASPFQGNRNDVNELTTFANNL
jgi:thiol-disulfide isomerase/thioredoxin